MGVLIADGYQVESGQLVVSTHGPNTPHLGAATVYNEEGAIMDEYVLPIAGKTVEALPPYAGENLFCSKKVQRRERLAEVPGAVDLNPGANDEGSAATMTPYHSDADSLSEFGHLEPALDNSETESVSSSASYAVRLEAIRTNAAASPKAVSRPAADVVLNY